MLRLHVGDQVKDKTKNEIGTIEGFRKDGDPLVRWDYGQLMRANPEDLVVTHPWNVQESLEKLCTPTWFSIFSTNENNLTNNPVIVRRLSEARTWVKQNAIAYLIIEHYGKNKRIVESANFSKKTISEALDYKGSYTELISEAKEPADEEFGNDPYVEFNMLTPQGNKEVANILEQALKARLHWRDTYSMLENLAKNRKFREAVSSSVRDAAYKYWKEDPDDYRGIYDETDLDAELPPGANSL